VALKETVKKKNTELILKYLVIFLKSESTYLKIFYRYNKKLDPILFPFSFQSYDIH